MKTNILKELWFQILVGGIALFLILEEAFRVTDNPNLLPSVILLGAFIVPATLVAYFYRYVRDRDISMPLLTTCFIVGGLLGTSAASIVEYGTLRNTGAAGLLGVSLIEETVKLVFPIAMFIGWRYRHEADGLLFGVAAGMGFAALETMGYGLVSFVNSQGNLGVLQQVLLVRGLLSPAGHAAWTGFFCAILWHQRQKTGHPLTMPVIGAFLLVVFLHVSWDMVNSINVQTPAQWTFYIVGSLFVITLGFGLMVWRFLKARRAALARG